MNLDLGSPMLDVAIGLSFVFFLLSVIASALSEGAAGILKLRSKELKKGLDGMLGDDEILKKLFEHTLIRTDLTKDPRDDVTDSQKAASSALQRWKRNRKRERGPSYISSRNFALAFAEIAGAGVKQKTLSAGLSQQLKALSGAPDKALPSAPALEKWFDDSMDRVSGWYKRKAQLVTIFFAVVVALGLNASAVRIVQRLSSDPEIRTAVAAQAQATAAKGDFGAAEKPADETQAAANLKQAGDDLETAYGKIDGLKLPLFWAGENVPKGTVGGIASAVVGWLLTIAAISLGAPFWFDTLNKFANLRLAGKKPEAPSP